MSSGTQQLRSTHSLFAPDSAAILRHTVSAASRPSSARKPFARYQPKQPVPSQFEPRASSNSDHTTATGKLDAAKRRASAVTAPRQRATGRGAADELSGVRTPARSALCTRTSADSLAVRTHGRYLTTARRKATCTLELACTHLVACINMCVCAKSAL